MMNSRIQCCGRKTFEIIKQHAVVMPITQCALQLNYNYMKCKNKWGIVYSSPKNENYVIIYSPSSFSNPVWVSFFCWTQKTIFWRMWVGPIIYLITHIFQISFFNVQQKKETHTGLEKTWGWVNDDIIFIFGWTVPLSVLLELVRSYNIYYMNNSNILNLLHYIYYLISPNLYTLTDTNK